jgi:hypothetical protein
MVLLNGCSRDLIRKSIYLLAYEKVRLTSNNFALDSESYLFLSRSTSLPALAIDYDKKVLITPVLCIQVIQLSWFQKPAKDRVPRTICLHYFDLMPTRDSKCYQRIELRYVFCRVGVNIN